MPKNNCNGGQSSSTTTSSGSNSVFSPTTTPQRVPSPPCPTGSLSDSCGAQVGSNTNNPNTGTGGQNQQGITNLPPPGTLIPGGQQQTPTGTTSTTGSGNNNNNCGPIMKSRGSLTTFMNPCLGQATPLTNGPIGNTNNPSSSVMNLNQPLTSNQGQGGSTKTNNPSSPVTNPAPATTQPTTTQPCIEPAAYVVDTADTKPCSTTKQQSLTPPADCTTLGYNVPGLEQKLENKAAPPLEVLGIIDDIVGCDSLMAQDRAQETAEIHELISSLTNPHTDVTKAANPDGSVTTKDLKGDALTNNPDGSESVTFSPFTLKSGILASGTYTKMADGTTIVKSSDGTVSTLRPDGGSVTNMPDGTVVSYISSDGATITTKPDGTKITEKNDGSWYITFPKKSDGSVSTYYENGTTITKISDGTSTVH